MSDSTTWLETISAAQSQKEVTANALFDAASPASLFGRHAEACTGLTWGYYGGRLWDGSNATLIANGTVSLTNTATNYVESTTAGVVSANTSAFTAGRIRIAKCVCSGGAVTSYEDHRTYTFPQASGVGTVTSVATGAGLTGGPITTTGTVALATIADARVFANISGGAAVPSANTLTGIIDAIIGNTQGTILYRSGAAWVALAVGTAGQLLQTQGAAANPAWQTQPYDVGGAVSGVPGASAVLLRYPVPRAVIFPASLTNSKGVAAIAATAQTDFDILKNGVSFGTMRFAAAGTTSSFISASGSTFAAGDILTVVAPASPDATLASVGFSLAGTR